MRRFLASNAPMLAAVGGYVIALGVAFVGIGIVNAERADDARARFGNTMAEDLAHLALEPLLRGDRIELGLLTNRLASRPEVRRIAIHTVDERLFVVAGGTAPPTAPTYSRPVQVDDTVAGDVRVTLEPDSFAVPPALVFAESWQFAFAGLALTVFLFYFGARLGSPRTAAQGAAGTTPEAAATLEAAMPAFVVVADLPRQAVPDDGEREARLEHGMAAGRRVANLYAGHAAALGGAGVVLWFPPSGSDDRCFEAVCAAWLVRRLLASDPATADDGPPVFRFGLDFSETGVRATDDGVDVSSVADMLLLASLAGDGELVLGQTAYAVLDRRDRIQLEALENPATDVLSSAAVPRGKVRGVADETEALIARQSDVLGGGTTSER